MATPIRTDFKTLRRRLAVILAKQLRYLQNKQRETGFLDYEHARQFKLLADALDDNIRLSRAIEQDMLKALEALTPQRLDAIAATPVETIPATPAGVAKRIRKPR